MGNVRRFKLCPTCGVENLPQAADCTQCGTDILGEPVEAVSESYDFPSISPPKDASEGDLILESLTNSAVRYVISEGQTIGRAEDADVKVTDLPEADTISRKMATFKRRGSQWYVQHIGNTNFIVVDGTEYENDDEVALYDGSVLGLALCQFFVRIKESS